jgi:hypothetical protein
MVILCIPTSKTCTVCFTSQNLGGNVLATVNPPHVLWWITQRLEAILAEQGLQSHPVGETPPSAVG